MPRKAKTRKASAKKSITRRTTVKRKIATRATAKKKAAATRKTAASKPAAPAKKKTPSSAKKIAISNLKQPYTKPQIMTYLADSTELTKKDIANVFEALRNLMSFHLKSRGPGEFTIPGLMKCVVKRKPPTKARKGVNPFTGEPMTFKAKPARNIVKIRPLKGLKELVE